MSTEQTPLQKIWADKKEQLQWGPGLSEMYETMINQIDANTAALSDLMQSLSVGTKTIEVDAGTEVKDATARENIGVLVDQVAALTEQVRELQQTIIGLTTPQEHAPSEPPVAVPSAITPPPSISTAQPDPSGAAPTSTTGAE